MKKHVANQGLTLLEIIIAVAVLSIGILAAASMQTSSLSLNGKSESQQEVVRLTQTELKLQRAVDHSMTTSTACLSSMPSGYSCSVTRTACSLSGTSISCSNSVSTPIAHQIIVSVTGTRDSSLDLQSLVPVTD